MKIIKCSICGRPFFQDPRTTTDYCMDCDPTACPQCNEEARKNSILPAQTQDFTCPSCGLRDFEYPAEGCTHPFHTQNHPK